MGHHWSAGTIDRNSSEPFYLQLSRLMEDQIESGAFAVGDKLPGESELCRSFDLARSTVRETLRTLQDRGRIKVIPRRGAFVIDSDRSGWMLQVSAGFLEGEEYHLNREVSSEVVEAGLMPVTADAADALSLRKGGVGFVLKRKRSLDGQIALYSENYLLPSLEHVITDSVIMSGKGSLNRVLRAAGFSVYGARRSVESVGADGRVSELLQVPVGHPLLLVTSVSWGKDKRVFDYYSSWVRTDVVKVTIEAKAPADDNE